MGVDVKKTAVVVERSSGQTFILDETAEVKVETEVKVICDGPQCSFGNDGKPSTYTWNEEDVKDNPEAVPDDAYRLLTLTLFNGKRFVFCSRQCLRDYMRNYKALRSAREMTAEMRENISKVTKIPPEDVIIPTEKEAIEMLTERINNANR